MRITITAQLKRRTEPEVQTFNLTADQPLVFNPKMLQDMMTLKISLEEEKPDVPTVTPKTATS